MRELEIVKDHDGLVRDRSSRAILSTDMQAYHAFKQKQMEKIRLSKLEDRVNSVEGKIDLILQLLEKQHDSGRKG